MKKNFKALIIAALLITAPFILSAQEPPHPNGGNAPTVGGGNRPVGSAPIDGGLGILIALGAALGTRRVCKARVSKD
jgi:hypothetical protein